MTVPGRVGTTEETSAKNTKYAKYCTPSLNSLQYRACLHPVVTNWPDLLAGILYVKKNKAVGPPYYIVFLSLTTAIASNPFREI